MKGIRRMIKITEFNLRYYKFLKRNIKELEEHFEKEFDVNRELYCCEGYDRKSFRVPEPYSNRCEEYMAIDLSNEEVLGYVGLIISPDDREVLSVNMYCKKGAEVRFHKMSNWFVLRYLVDSKRFSGVMFQTDINNKASKYIHRMYSKFFEVYEEEDNIRYYRRKK